MLIESLAKGEENFEFSDEGNVEMCVKVEMQTHLGSSRQLK